MTYWSDVRGVPKTHFHAVCVCERERAFVCHLRVPICMCVHPCLIWKGREVNVCACVCAGARTLGCSQAPRARVRRGCLCAFGGVYARTRVLLGRVPGFHIIAARLLR